MQPEQSDEPAVENKDLINYGVHLLDEDLHEHIIINYVCNCIVYIRSKFSID